MASSLRSPLSGLLGMRAETPTVTGRLQYPYEEKVNHLPEGGFDNKPVYWVIRQSWLGDDVPLG